jgi:hypothetical protein
VLPFERLRALETRGGFLRWVQFRNVDVLSRKKKSTVWASYVVIQTCS